MGLAASQARFLAITSRKMNCEFQSMQIAQQKLSVTRDLQKAAQDYQSSLNATKLVWDTADDLGIFDVSYDVMMNPTVLNEFDPFLITDLNGKIVLSEPMFDAALAAGIIDANGDPTGKLFEGGKPFVDSSITDDPSTTDNEELLEQTRADEAKTNGSRNAFLYQLGKVNLIDSVMADKIMRQGIYTKSGLGGPIYDKTVSNALSTQVFIDYMKNKVFDSGEIPQNVAAGSVNDFDIVYSKDVDATHKAGDLIYKRGSTVSLGRSVIVKEYNAGDIADRAFTFTAPRGAKATIPCEDTSGTTHAVNALIEGKQFKIYTGDSVPCNGVRVGFETSESSYQKGDFVYGLNFKSLLSDGTNSLMCTNSIDLKDSANVGKFFLTKNGNVVSETNAEKLTLGDLLTGKYELGYHSDGTVQNYKAAYTKVLEAMAKVLGYKAGNEFKGLNIDAESNTALEQAFEFTKSLLNKCYTDNTSSDATNLRCDAEKRNNVVKGSNNIYSLSLTNLLKSFLTNFAVAMEGFDCGYNVDKDLAKDSKYVTSDLNYKFLIHNDAAMTDTIMLNSDFYNMLYNQIATCGACTDKTKQQLVTDNEWLQQQLKRGSLFISSLNNDGYYYQGAYTLNGHVQEVKDENAIARAELEYSVQKSKLNTKEESLELQMKNLDMEISALTTEYDTVKNLISKGIEKVFTMFST